MISCRFQTIIFTWLWSLLLLVTLCHSVSSASPVVMTDHDGITHRIHQPFQRIISLYPAHTENLAKMGAQETLIGISTSDTYPESILSKPRFSYHDSIEKFLGAQPDCILIRPMITRSAGNLVKQLKQFGITIISLQPTTPDELYQYWVDLGEISGKQRKAAQMIEEFKAGLKALSLRVDPVSKEHRPLVYFESIHARMKTFSPSSITMFCLESAGGINIATDAIPRKNSNIAAYSKERILAHSNKIDIYLAQTGRMNKVTREQIISEPGFGAIKAVQENRVYLVEEQFVSRPTTRLLEGITRINRLLYNHHDS